MPHLVILYTPQLDADCDMGALCRGLARTMRGCTDEAGKPVFPVGGIRVLAYPAAHHAVADAGTDDAADKAFCYLQLRMARGRSAAVHQAVGQALTEATRAHFAPVMQRRLLGLTLQIDEGAETFDAKVGNLHAHFAAAAAAKAQPPEGLKT